MQSYFFPRRIISSSYAFGSTSKSYFSVQISNLCTMNRSSNRGSRPWSSNLESRHHQNPENSSISANAKYSTSCTGSPQPRGIVESNISRNSQTVPIVDSLDEEEWPALSFSGKKGISRTKRATPATTSSESAIGHYGRAPVAASPGQPYNPVCATETVSTGSGRAIVMEHIIPVCSENVIPHPRSTSPKIEYGLTGHGSSERSNNSISQPGKTPQMNSDCYGYKPFDICFMPKTAGIKTSQFYKNKEERKNRELSLNDTRNPLLRPGMVLLKNFITHADQIEIIKKCRDLGLGPGGFYQPGYSDGAKLRLHMMCLGKDWDPQRRSYEEFRAIDGAKPPIIPVEFKKLVCDALGAYYDTMRKNSLRNHDKAIPWMEPDICIVNFYTASGKLGLHQDRDESPDSIKDGLPVVSFSIGDSADFLYGDDRDVDKAAKVELKSGDVLIFGGKSRNVFHGVPTISPNSAPKFLADEANFRPGRLNLTFRKY